MTDTSPTTLPHWPTGPACYGWLALDARGCWRLRGERVEHGGLHAFLSANYAHDGVGNWLVHNGPQRVFVELEAAPWILRMLPDDVLQTHTGQLAMARAPELVDEIGRVSLGTNLGPAAIDDRDLSRFLAELQDARGNSVDEALLLALLDDNATAPLQWRSLPVTFARANATPQLLGFQRKPAPTP